MNWIDVKTKMPNPEQYVLGWDTVRNAPRVITLHGDVWILESRVEIPCNTGQISHWCEIQTRGL